MAKNIYLIRDQQQVGPFSEEDLKAGLNWGDFTGKELVWRGGMSEWEPLKQFLNPPSASELERPVPPSSNQTVPNDHSFVMREVAGCIRGLYILAFVAVGLVIVGILLALYFHAK